MIPAPVTILPGSGPERAVNQQRAGYYLGPSPGHPGTTWMCRYRSALHAERIPNAGWRTSPPATQWPRRLQYRTARRMGHPSILDRPWLETRPGRTRNRTIVRTPDLPTEYALRSGR